MTVFHNVIWKKEFYDGKDTIGDKKCKSWEEYYRVFVEDVMIPEVEKEGMEEFEEMMEQAKDFYEANRERLQEMMDKMKESFILSGMFHKMKCNI